MKFDWSEGSAEAPDGRDTEGKVLTLQIGRFVFAFWVTWVKR